MIPLACLVGAIDGTNLWTSIDIEWIGQSYIESLYEVAWSDIKYRVDDYLLFVPSAKRREKEKERCMEYYVMKVHSWF